MYKLGTYILKRRGSKEGVICATNKTLNLGEDVYQIRWIESGNEEIVNKAFFEKGYYILPPTPPVRTADYWKGLR
jgi:hypothetical protein